MQYLCVCYTEGWAHLVIKRVRKRDDRVESIVPTGHLHHNKRAIIRHLRNVRTIEGLGIGRSYTATEYSRHHHTCRHDQKTIFYHCSARKFHFGVPFNCLNLAQTSGREPQERDLPKEQ